MNFSQELSKALHAADMELGVAISGYKEVIESAYDFPAISKAADFLTAMTYDYHGGWEQVTGHHTPLTPPSKDYLPYYSIVSILLILLYHFNTSLCQIVAILAYNNFCFLYYSLFSCRNMQLKP